MSKGWILVFIAFLLLLVLISFMYSPKSNLVPFSGEDSFCVDKGYDHHSLFGAYSEKYGKIKCVSCYDRDCMYEEFNVTETRFGWFKEVLRWMK